MNKLFAFALIAAAVGFSAIAAEANLILVSAKTIWSFKSLADAASAFIVVLMADVAATATMAVAIGAPR